MQMSISYEAFCGVRLVKLFYLGIWVGVLFRIRFGVCKIK